MTKVFDYEIKFDNAGLEQNLLKQFGIGSPAQKFLDYMILNGMKPYVPFDQGILQRSADINTLIGNGKIIYRTPYARRLYYNPQYNFQGSPMRGARWAERAADDLKKSWIAELQNFINRS